MQHQTLARNPNSKNKKRKWKESHDDMRNSAYLKLCAIVHQLRPHFIQVLRTPDFRNCGAAHEIRKRMKLVMDLYTQMQIEGRTPQTVKPTAAQCMTTERTLEIEEADKKEKPGQRDPPSKKEKPGQRDPQSKKEKLGQKDHSLGELPEKSADKKISLDPVISGEKAGDIKSLGTHIVGKAISGWNFITFINRKPPAYYGVTKESFRLGHSDS